MKNDDAALVKEMKSGLCWRIRARAGVEKPKEIGATGMRACVLLTLEGRTKGRGLIRNGSEITVDRFEK